MAKVKSAYQLFKLIMPFLDEHLSRLENGNCSFTYTNFNIDVRITIFGDHCEHIGYGVSNTDDEKVIDCDELHTREDVEDLKKLIQEYL